MPPIDGERDHSAMLRDDVAGATRATRSYEPVDSPDDGGFGSGSAGTSAQHRNPIW